MTRKRNFACISAFLMLLCLPNLSFSEPASPDVNLVCINGGVCNGNILSQGKVRTFHYYMQGGVGANLSPIYHVIFVLHDITSNGLTFDNNVLAKSFDDMAGLMEFIVVYPDAYNKRWNFGPDSTVTDVDDVAFIQQLAEYFETTHGTKQLKVYAVGMANGGLMVFRLGCEMSYKLNGIAVIDATMPISLSKTCKPSRPLPVLLFEGRNDTMVPLTKNVMYDFEGMPPIATLTAAQTFNFWAAVDQIDVPSRFVFVPVAQYDGTVIYSQTKQLKDGLAVRMYTIFGGGHTWPGGGQYLPVQAVGKVTHNLEAAPVIANFFYSY
jgi:polyhydroxybutyrate depolymerase